MSTPYGKTSSSTSREQGQGPSLLARVNIESQSTIPSERNLGSNERRSNTRSDSPVTSEQNDGSSETPVPEDPSPLNRAIVDSISTIIERYRKGDFGKPRAFFTIMQALEQSDVDDRAKELAFSGYVRTIDRIESLKVKSFQRGSTNGQSSSCEPIVPTPDPTAIQDTSISGHERTDHTTHPRANPETDRAVNEFLDSVRGSKRSHSSGYADEDSAPEDGVETQKRSKLDEHLFPWYEKEIIARETSNPSSQRTRELLQFFSTDFKVTIQSIRFAHSSPPGFPATEWENIIRGKSVNLDVVFSSLHHVGAPKENIGRVGRTEISLGRAEPSRKVETSGNWTSAWNATIKAIKFAFPHCEDELRDYAEYIEGLFSARVVSSHRSIILFDSTVRDYVGGGQRCLLT